MIGNLPPSRRLPTPRRYAARRQLEDLVARRRIPSRRRRVVYVVVIFVIVGSTAAGITLLRQAPVTDRSSARCYTVDEVGAGENFAGTTVGAPGVPGSTEQVRNAVSACSDLWRKGFLLPGRAGMQRPAPGTVNPVPTLIACTLPDGRAGIFPGDGNTCATLGLPLAAG
jgi:hypothetical protein